MRHSLIVAVKRSAVTWSSPLEGRLSVRAVRRVPLECLQQAKTLEARTIPSIFLAAVVGLVFVQLWLALG